MFDWQDIINRAVKTFYQAAVATLPTVLVVGNMDEVKAVVVTAVIAGGSALVSFVGNVLAQYFQGRKAE